MQGSDGVSADNDGDGIPATLLIQVPHLRM